MELIKAIFEWIQNNLSGFLIGLRIMESESAKMAKELREAELRLELRKNEIENERNFANQSNGDVIESVRSGNRRI